ncbi:hypothetical protein Q4503_10965 [Colwellia sp. 6_MG-2023]|uniref:hypothetical protein n=1 Tax=Colwellia sp. 6_MG-2023 TaxID=3062676 RepID=UPI0026E1B0EA|nr:hypothetical protein [Colwellia sp. 6_MG-2023]MDO6488224.1 hypothetical protein [Colwellia sp. 6_MG-2023]
MNWYTAERVTVSSGSTIVRVVSGESVAAIRAHDGLEINSFNAVDIELTYTEEGTGDQVIQLVRPWPHASQTEQAAQVVPTAAHFNDSVQVLTNTYEHVFAQLGSYFSFGTQATGNVTFKAVRVDESDVTVRCINQWDADLSTLEASASSSVADLNAIDTAINGSGGLVEVAAQVSDDLEAVDAVLSGYVATAKTYRDNALTYRNTAENYRDEAEGLRDTTYSYRNEVSGWHTSISGWKTAAESARDLAEQYRDEAEAFKDQAGQIVGGNYVDQSTTVNGKALSEDIVLDHEDVGAISSVGGKHLKYFYFGDYDETDSANKGIRGYVRDKEIFLAADTGEESRGTELYLDGKRVYHTGHLPDAGDVEALPEHQVTTSAYGYSTDLNKITDKNLITTLSGSYTNSPLGSGSSNVTGILKVERRAFDAGFAVYQEVKIQGGSVHWRYGTGQPLVFGDWNQDFSENHLPEISEVVGLQDKLDEIELFALAGL